MLNETIPAGDAGPSAQQVFWANAVTTVQLTAVQILDDMVTVNFNTEGMRDDIPVPVLTWYFWQRASVLVQAEHQMSDVARARDMQQAVAVAGDLCEQLTWLETCERADAAEQNALHALHEQIVDALKQRPYYPSIRDQTYAGKVPEPQRIQLPKA